MIKELKPILADLLEPEKKEVEKTIIDPVEYVPNFKKNPDGTDALDSDGNKIEESLASTKTEEELASDILKHELQSMFAVKNNYWNYLKQGLWNEKLKFIKDDTERQDLLYMMKNTSDVDENGKTIRIRHKTEKPLTDDWLKCIKVSNRIKVIDGTEKTPIDMATSKMINFTVDTDKQLYAFWTCSAPRAIKFVDPGMKFLYHHKISKQHKLPFTPDMWSEAFEAFISKRGDEIKKYIPDPLELEREAALKFLQCHLIKAKPRAWRVGNVWLNAHVTDQPTKPGELSFGVLGNIKIVFTFKE